MSNDSPHVRGAVSDATLVDLLRRRAAEQGDRRAYTFLVDGESEEVHVSYAELDARARAVAAHLQALRLAGERALLLYPSGLEYSPAFFGCLYAGVTAVPAYPPRPNRSTRPAAGDRRGRARASRADDRGRCWPDWRRARPPRRSWRRCAGWPPTRSPTRDAGDWQPSRPRRGRRWRSSSTPRARPATPKGVMVTPRQPAAQRGADPPRFRHDDESDRASAGCRCTTTWG